VDPGSTILYGAVESASIYAIAGDNEGRASPQMIATWSADNGFDGIVALHQVLPIPGQGPYRFMTLGNDPQLAFSLGQWPVSAVSYRFEIKVRLYADLREADGAALSTLVTALESAKNTSCRELQLRADAERRLSDALQRLSENEQGLNDARLRAEHDEQALVQAESTALRMQRGLEEEVAKLSAALTQMQSQLQIASQELERIKATRGWRLLSAYGRVKYALRRALG